MKDFGKLWNLVWERNKGYEYYKFNVDGKNDYYKQGMLEFAADDRKIKPRINFQSVDLMSGNADDDDEDEEQE